MNTKKIKLMYFSATGTTQKVLESIGQGYGAAEVEHLNVTLPDSNQHPITSFTDELVIIGAPVYGGRIPLAVVSRLKRFKANGTPVVLVVVYGNREFDDALLELKNLAIEQGFKPIAGAAFIGEHSFASEDIPIANGRPDEMDVQKARDFGVKIREKVTALQSAYDYTDLKVPGTFPYTAQGAREMEVSPITDENVCTTCGTCATVCPTDAISVTDQVTTQTKNCIRCCACIKNCPSGARVIGHDEWKYIANWLRENCGQRKEPQLFGINA